jgi:hypothetical protein
MNYRLLVIRHYDVPFHENEHTRLVGSGALHHFVLLRE